MSETPADRTLTRALEELVNDENGTSSDDLCITSTEILILTILTSQGLPVHHSDDWNKLIVGDLLEEDMMANYKIYFNVMTGVVKAASETWLEVSRRKLEQKVRKLKSAELDDQSRSNIAEQISILQRDYDNKKMTFSEAEQFCKDPVTFAKKTVTLLEAIRKNIGPVDLNYAGGKKSRALNKSENGLGTKCINWFSKELSRWGHVSHKSIAIIYCILQ